MFGCCRRRCSVQALSLSLSTIGVPSSRAAHGHPLRIFRGMRLDPEPTHSFGSLAERDAVEDFGNHLGGLGDRHSGTVEEQIAVSKRDIALAHSLKLTPPRISLQYALFLQTTL